jgi:hypothetical protein
VACLENQRAVRVLRACAGRAGAGGLARGARQYRAPADPRVPGRGGLCGRARSRHDPGLPGLFERLPELAAVAACPRVARGTTRGFDLAPRGDGEPAGGLLDLHQALSAGAAFRRRPPAAGADCRAAGAAAAIYVLRL